jgi:hypothetical protein
VFSAWQGHPRRVGLLLVLTRPELILRHLPRRKPNPLSSGRAIVTQAQLRVCGEDLDAAADQQRDELPPAGEATGQAVANPLTQTQSPSTATVNRPGWNLRASWADHGDRGAHPELLMPRYRTRQLVRAWRERHLESSRCTRSEAVRGSIDCPAHNPKCVLQVSGILGEESYLATRHLRSRWLEVPLVERDTHVAIFSAHPWRHNFGG